MRRLRAGVVLFLLYAGRVAPAAAQFDPSGSWRTLHTAHFRVHFRPAERAIALRAAREAERAYALLAAELSAPRRTVDLALNDDVDAGNGLTTVFPTPRIVVNLAVPATDPALASYDDWLRVVITHELTHAFHLDRTRGPWRVLQAVFGRAPGLFPEEYQPSWVTEGLATYYESKLTTAGRVRGSFHTQILAADAAGGESRRPWDALLFTPWPDGFMPYAYGSRFFHHIADSLGDSIVPRFVEWTAGQWIPFRVGRPLDKVGGKALLADAWAPATRPAPAPDAAAGGRVLARGLRASPTPEVSADGRRVAWLSSDGRGAPRVVIADAATFRIIRTHRVTGQVTFDWTGDTLVIAQLDFTSLYAIRSDLYRWTPDGRWRRVTRDARLTEPRAGGGVLAGVAIDPAGNHPALAALPDTVGATWGDVVPSPDGRTIAATRQRNGRWALVRWPRAAPESLAVLYAGPGVIAAPVWSADGALYFVADVSGYPQVHRWTPAAGIAVVTADSLGARDPAPLSGGDLLYTSVRADGWVLLRAPPVARAADTTAVAASFDSAATVTSRETGYDAWPSLRPQFWIPLFSDAAQAGRFVGAATAGSDVLGRTSYAADVMLAPTPFRAVGGFALVSRVLGNPVLDLSGSSDWSLVGIAAPAFVVSERKQEAALGATVATRRWRSAASLRLAAEFEDTRFTVLPGTPLDSVCIGCQARDEVGGSLTAAVASYISAPLAISPQDGFVTSFTLRRREQQGTRAWSDEWRGRLDLYAAIHGLGTFAAPALALRLATGAIDGPLPRVFGVGGVASASYAIGFGQAIGTERTFPVRGFDGSALIGRRAGTGALELRVPLALIGRSIGHLPVGVDKLSLHLFSDAGDAWGPGARPRLARLWSAGAELAADIAESYDLALAFRLGLAEPLTAPPGGQLRRPRVYVAFASDF